MPDDIKNDCVVFEFGAHQIALIVSNNVFSPTGFAQSFAGILESHLPVNGAVCELGIGTGVLSILAGLKGAKVVGLDRNPDAIDLARENWMMNDLPSSRMDFRESDLFSGLRDTDIESFDLVWSNPPVLPDLPGVSVPVMPKYRYEVSGPLGRDVLDAMITGTRSILKPGGSMLTIATSLQGWKQTKTLLNRHWSKWSVVDEVSLPLTDECGPEYVAWWKAEQARTGEIYLEARGSETVHTLWFLQAWNT